MEFADKLEVILLDGLNPTPSPTYNRAMRTATGGFESALQYQPFHFTAESTIDSGTTPEHWLKSRLHKITRIPSSVAQTHTRRTLKLSLSRIDKKKLPTTVTAASPKTALSLVSVAPSTATTDDSVCPASETAPPAAVVQLKLATKQCQTQDDEHSNDPGDREGREFDLMGPCEGFTVPDALYAKVKARVRRNSSTQHQQQQVRHSISKKHPTKESGSSQEESAASKRSNNDTAEIESNTSNSNPCTLSAGTSGDISSSFSHHGVTNRHDPSNDSDGTVTDLEDSTLRLRQRKYSLSSQHSSAGPDEINAETAELIADEAAEDAIDAVEAVVEGSAIGDGPDPVELFEQVFNRQHLTEQAIAASLQELRQLILAYGIPEQPSTSKSKTSSIRGKCWKLLLEVHHVSAQEYVSLVKQGKPEEYSKIRNDTFRTMATDDKYKSLVEEDSLIRVLCAFAWSTQATTAQGTDVSFTYVQGMNVLAAPFLYTMSEIEAFYSYSNLLRYCCPLYVQPTLQGVHCGIKLLEQCLCKIDPELYDYLKLKKLSAELYAFPSVLTICACTPPLEQAMQLWDFLLAWGIHLNIICIIAQLYLIRDELMSHASPMKLLRIFPDLNADKIIRETIRMVKLLPDELYDLLVRHPYDPTVAEQIS